MICPTCIIPMHQKVEIVAEQEHLQNNLIHIGGGVGDDYQYTTWELKECPSCSRLCLEHYTAVVVADVVQAVDIAQALSKTLGNK